MMVVLAKTSGVILVKLMINEKDQTRQANCSSMLGLASCLISFNFPFPFSLLKQSSLFLPVFLGLETTEKNRFKSHIPTHDCYFSDGKDGLDMMWKLTSPISEYQIMIHGF